MRSSQRPPLVFPLLLVLIGIVVLLNSYLLIDTDIVQFWPIVLILVGLLVLWRGDLAPSWQAHTFGITRGSVESATLEVNSAEIDVRIRPLGRAGRLIAGQYTARSRPKLLVRNNHAHLELRRGSTWLLSFADWDLGLANDIPWQVMASAHLGKIQADLRHVPLRQAHIATGFGDIRVIAPQTVTGPLYVRSTFGDLNVSIPMDVPALIRLDASPLSSLFVDEDDFKPNADNTLFTTPAYDPDADALEITLSATFGNVLLSLMRQTTIDDEPADSL